MFCEQPHDALNDIVKRHPHTPVFLLGDFNYPKINWSLPSCSLSSLSADSLHFVELCEDFNLTQLVTQPTRMGPTSSNVLDLILTTVPDLVHSISYIPGIYPRHCFVHFNLTGSLRRRSNNRKTETTHAAIMTQSTVNSNRILRALLMASLIAVFNKTGTCSK